MVLIQFSSYGDLDLGLSMEVVTFFSLFLGVIIVSPTICGVFKFVVSLIVCRFCKFFC